MRRRAKLLFLIFSVALWGSSCGFYPTPGELGVGMFGYRCTSALDDAYCRAMYASPTSSPFAVPERLAAGARVQIVYSQRVTNKSDGVVSATEGTVFAAADLSPSGVPDPVLEASASHTRRPGVATVFGTIRRGVIGDLIHILVLQPTALEMWTDADRSPSDPTLRRRVVVRPLADGVELAGVLDCVYSSSDPSIVELSGPFLREHSSGTATITAKCGEVTQSLAVVVQAPIDAGADADALAEAGDAGPVDAADGGAE